jgi:hypothetical protein
VDVSFSSQKNLLKELEAEIKSLPLLFLARAALVREKANPAGAHDIVPERLKEAGESGQVEEVGEEPLVLARALRPISSCRASLFSRCPVPFCPSAPPCSKLPQALQYKMLGGWVEGVIWREAPTPPAGGPGLSAQLGLHRRQAYPGISGC